MIDHSVALHTPVMFFSLFQYFKLPSPFIGFFTFILFPCLYLFTSRELYSKSNLSYTEKFTY